MVPKLYLLFSREQLENSDVYGSLFENALSVWNCIMAFIGISGNCDLSIIKIV